LRRAEDVGRAPPVVAGGRRARRAALARPASRCSGVRLARAPRLPRVDFELTDEQRLIQDTVRAFVDERVLPVANQNDIDHKLDLELIEGMAELGILGIVVPEEYGGAGLDYVSEALACEEIERGE